MLRYRATHIIEARSAISVVVQDVDAVSGAASGLAAIALATDAAPADTIALMSAVRYVGCSTSLPRDSSGDTRLT